MSLVRFWILRQLGIGTLSHSCHWYLYCFPWLHDACFNWAFVVNVCFDWSFVRKVYFYWLLVVEVCSDWSVGML